MSSSLLWIPSVQTTSHSTDTSGDTSPYLTSLAQQGVVFENAISTASWTLPSHAAMLTGLYPHETRMEHEKDVLSGKWPNLGNVMRQRGYRTAAFSANYQFFTRSHGFAQGFTRFEEYEQTLGGILNNVHLSRLILQKLSRVTTGVDYAFFGVKNWASAERVDKNALDWIGKGDRPFFLVLNYTDVHEPSLPPEPYLHMYTANVEARNQSMHFQDNCVDANPKASCGPDQQQFIDTYDGSIRYVDDSIKHLISQLKERGQLENTIVVFTSDHGQEFGEHSLYGHAKSLYRGEIQVPLLFWKPGLVSSHRSVCRRRSARPIFPQRFWIWLPLTISRRCRAGLWQRYGAPVNRFPTGRNRSRSLQDFMGLISALPTTTPRFYRSSDSGVALHILERRQTRSVVRLEDRPG